MCHKNVRDPHLIAFAVTQLLEDMTVAKKIPEWNALHLFGAFTAIAYTARKFFQRRTYSEILRSKYWDKLQKVDGWRRVLTRLACYDGDDVPDRSKEGMSTEEIINEMTSRRSMSGVVVEHEDTDSTSLELSEDDSENIQLFWRYGL